MLRDALLERLSADELQGARWRTLDFVCSGDEDAAVGLARNPRAERMAAPCLELQETRSAQPPERVYSPWYQGARRRQRHRAVLVVQENTGELLPHSFELVTNDHRSNPEPILERYRARGTSESRLVEPTGRLERRLSGTGSRGAQVRNPVWNANASTYLPCVIADGLLHAMSWLARSDLSSDGESPPPAARPTPPDRRARAPRCQGRRTLLAAIHDPDSIRRILHHLGLPTEPPAVAPARPPPQPRLPW